MKSDSPVKKHHFWILFGVVPLVTLIGVLMVDAKVGSKIDERQKEIETANKDIESKKNPKPVKLIEALDKSFVVVGNKQGELHKENWGRQKELFVWPRNSDVFRELERRPLAFGSDLPDLSAIFGEFQRAETYQHEYSSAVLNKKDGTYTQGTGMADTMAPTQFLGGWQSVLRYVNDFGQVRVSKEQVWLILEDMWVQQSLLSGLRSVNLDMAQFEQVKADDPAPGAKGQTKTKKLFRNRIWELAVEIAPDEGTGRQRLTGTLTNISERLQLLGKSPDGGNGMTLNVWLSASANAQPVAFKIGGEFLPGRGAMKSIKDKDGNTQVVPANVLPISPNDDHLLPTGTSTETQEITRVEQVFDPRTVPLKRIDMLVLGHPAAMDARSAGQPGGLVMPLSTENGGLFAPAFVKDPNAVDPNAAPGVGGVAGGPMGPGVPPMGPVGLPPGGVRPGGPDGGMGGANTAAKPVGGGPLLAVIDGNKKRYLAVTSQVRRMPVAMVVVVDQAYIQDVLLSLSNSPLRFQITQVNWTRFRGTLDGLGINAGGTGSGNLDYGGSLSSPLGGFGKGAGDPDFGGRPSGSGATGIPPGLGSMPVGPGGPGGPGYPGSGSGSSVVTESQITSGLVELSVYGVVSLYESPKAEPPAGGAAGPNPPVPNPPTPNQPVPMVPNNPVPPKTRRRARA